MTTSPPEKLARVAEMLISAHNRWRGTADHSLAWQAKLIEGNGNGLDVSARPTYRPGVGLIKPRPLHRGPVFCLGPKC